MYAALTPTAGNVLFTGDLDGNFLVLDARNGKTLYSFNTGGPIAGGVVTYEQQPAGNTSRSPPAAAAGRFRSPGALRSSFSANSAH